MSEWQPIESCVFDGSLVVFYDSKYGNAFIDYAEHDADAAWWRERGVTHWFAMPEPPK